jgi:SET domain-containing protein
VEVRESRIEGLGVFAARAYASGVRVRRVSIVREVTEAAPLREPEGERTEHCAYPSGKVVLWGFPDRHVNHSCDPNAYAQEEGDGSRLVHIVARRPIAAGEEITFDYNLNLSGGSSWPCRCVSPRCRGETIGDFFRLPEQRQLEYLPLLAPWFVRRHAARIARLQRLAT